MNSTISTKLDMEQARVILFGAIGAGYTAVGIPFRHPSRMLLIQNHTDAELWFSNNTNEDKFALLPKTDLILDISSNQTYTRGLFFPVWERIYVKQKGVPTLGDVIVASFYGED